MTTQTVPATPADLTLLSPFDQLYKRLGDRMSLTDYYSGPFQKYHHFMSSGSRWDLAVLADAAARVGGDVIDLGSGSGRVSLHLAELGHRVLAVDRSVEAIAMLRSIAGEHGLTDRIRTEVADLTTPAGISNPNRYLLAAMGDVGVNSFTEAELRQVVRAAATAMAPEGQFCLTVFGDGALDQMKRFSTLIPVEPSFFDDGTGVPTLVWTAILFDEATGTLTQQFLLQDLADGGRIRLAHRVDTIWTRSLLTSMMAAEGYVERGASECSVAEGGAAGWTVWSVEYAPA
jgi:SAM-dependent methyltransferase